MGWDGFVSALDMQKHSTPKQKEEKALWRPGRYEQGAGQGSRSGRMAKTGIKSVWDVSLAPQTLCWWSMATLTLCWDGKKETNECKLGSAKVMAQGPPPTEDIRLSTGHLLPTGGSKGWPCGQSHLQSPDSCQTLVGALLPKETRGPFPWPGEGWG